MANNSDRTPLSFKEKLGYGVGDMASNFYLGFFGLFLLYYYTDIYGIAPSIVGTMLLVSKLVDAISDPGMGLIADRTNTRLGKYRPYIVWGAVPYGLLGYAIFLGPELSDTGKIIYAYVTYIAVMLAFTAINVPYTALLAVISPVASERTKATTYRFVCASTGTLLVAAFATPLTNWLGGGDDLLGFRLTMAIFAVLSVALFWITFATTKERIRPARHTSSVRKDLTALLQNTSWIFLSIACVLIVVGLVARFASIVFYVKYYMGDDGGSVFLFFDKTATISSMGLLGQLTGVFFTPFLERRFNKHHIIMAMCFIHAVLLMLCYFIPPEMFWLTTLVHYFGIATFGVSITLLFVMFSDCSEYGEWKTKIRTSGLIVSASLFALKVGSAIGGSLPGFILDGFGFVANQAQSPESLMGIRLMFNLIPAAVFFISGFFLLGYKIDKNLLDTVEKDMHRCRHSDEEENEGREY